ncbi:recombinase family protein [Streptomyces asiaticus]
MTTHDRAETRWTAGPPGRARGTTDDHRCSTEDLQDPETSRNWQLTRARALIEPAGGEIVAEYFDAGHSRALPWKRRPQAAALLTALRDPHRGFDAVVIGEPQRTFYGNQFGNTFPLFTHFNVPLWVPEIGGPIDPDNEAHDLVMSVFGGMSKGERNRVKIRVRTAMGSQAKIEGRFLGGRPPYGYRLADAGPHPNPAKAADGKRLHRLEPDPETAPIVVRIFTEYLRGTGLYAIAEGLTRDNIPCPSAHDRARNPHRDGHAWSKNAVRAILTNPRYTGHEVWNKQRKQEVLLDIDDVTLGHRTQQTWNTADQWIWSTQPVHEPLISKTTFTRAQARRHDRRQHHPAERSPRTTPRTYALRGLIRCSLCDRKMQGTFNHGHPHYRCRYPYEYAKSGTLDHPLTVYIREAVILPKLDRWIAQVFAPRAAEEHAAGHAAIPTGNNHSLARPRGRPPHHHRLRPETEPIPRGTRRRCQPRNRRRMDQQSRGRQSRRTATAHHRRRRPVHRPHRRADPRHDQRPR